MPDPNEELPQDAPAAEVPTDEAKPPLFECPKCGADLAAVDNPHKCVSSWPVTDSEVRDAVYRTFFMGQSITKTEEFIPLRGCSFCGTDIGYVCTPQGTIAFRSSCNCCPPSPDQPRLWFDAAAYINNQTRNDPDFGDIAAEEAKRFGVVLPKIEDQRKRPA